jgi:hypothetical protein
MKKLFSLIALVAAFSIAATLADKAPKMVFKQDTVDYGTIAQNSDPLRKFEFTNNGNAPLIITEAKGSCGCTVPTYPKKPIAPGESAAIEVRYDTNRVGDFRKSIRITTNEKEITKTKNEAGVIEEKETAKTHILYIKGNVTATAAAPAGTPAKSKGALDN